MLMAKAVLLSGTITPAQIYHPATAAQDRPAAKTPPPPRPLLSLSALLAGRNCLLADWGGTFLNVARLPKSPVTTGDVTQSELPPENKRSSADLILTLNGVTEDTGLVGDVHVPLGRVSDRMGSCILK